MTSKDSYQKGGELKLSNNDPQFKVTLAAREACKASIQIEGLSGMGKSGLALIIAHALEPEWKKIGAVDTENKSLNLYVGLSCSSGGKFEPFLHGNFTDDIGYKPTNYLAWYEAMLEKGATVIIADSISHAWSYKGGVLDLVSKAKASGNKLYAKDSYAAWSDPEVSKEKNELLQLMRSSRAHIITTTRVKEKMDYTTDNEGKTKLVSLGDVQIQQADLKYEPDLVLRMIAPGSKEKHPVAEIVKTRYAIFTKGQNYEFTPELLEQLRAYLAEGIDPETLLEEQRQDYITGVKNTLDAKPGLVPIWNEIKKTAGFAENALDTLPLEPLKQMFLKLTTD